MQWLKDKGQKDKQWSTEHCTNAGLRQVSNCAF